MEKKSLGSFIALLRKEKGLTQKQLAELLNVSDKTVSHWECDETSPDISVLPQLAEILGVSVDELLRGEKNPTETPLNDFQHYQKPQRKINSLFAKIKGGFTGDVAERYRYFRMLSLIGTVIAAVVLLTIILSIAFSAYFVLSSIPVGLIALLGSLWTIALSLGFSIGARFLFSKEIAPDENTDKKERDYIYKANKVCFNNIFLVFCAFPLALVSIGVLPIFANLLIALAVVAALKLVLTAILTKKGLLKRNDRQILLTKYVSICVVSAVAVSGSLIFLQKVWNPSPENIIFYSAEEFKAYMETPKEKPENAYIIDGVMMTTLQPTIMLTPGWNDEIDSPVKDSGSVTDHTSAITETVYGYYGEEIVSFTRLNNEVYDYSYNEEQGSFHIITYEAKIKVKEQTVFIDDIVPILIVLYCIADVVICFALCRRKVKNLKTDT